MHSTEFIKGTNQSSIFVKSEIKNGNIGHHFRTSIDLRPIQRH